MKLPLPKVIKTKRSAKTTHKSRTPTPAGNTVQYWLPVRDVSNGILRRSDDRLVAIIRVEPAAFTLLSQAERARRIAALHEVIQALPGAVQVCAVPRPIDLDAYITGLEAKLVEVDGSRKTILRGYVHYVRGLAATAAAMERRFYLLVTGDGKNKGVREELLHRMMELVAALNRAELQAHLCSDQEVLDLLFCFFHPAQAAFERAAIPAVAPVYTTAKDVMEYGLD
ncbi:hypothetical protein SY88_00235 [Clostridiales bacterium PH28_bin88]|nr:hypothetical protein SY88_00235 [Clostridiales bacterium PH28_bin88]